MDEQPKRKLRLMNEVLPDPRLNKVSGGGARERTMKHMQALLATAAAATATAAGACSGSDESPKPDVTPSAAPEASQTKPAPSASVTHTDPVPPASAKPVDSAGQNPVVASSAVPDAGPKQIVKPPPQPPPGYQVVDPVPEPYRHGKNGPAVP